MTAAADTEEEQPLDSPFRGADKHQVLRQPGNTPPRPAGGSPTRSPAERSRSLSGLMSEVLAGGLSSGLSSLGSSLSRRRQPSPTKPPAPPLLVPVRLLPDAGSGAPGADCLLRLPMDASIEQLQQECVREAGVLLHLQRLFVEERPAEAGLVNLLRSTAGHLTSREKLGRTVVQWVNFVFLPESVNREIKGAGLINWANDNVWAHLAAQPPGRVQVAVSLLSTRRYALQLSCKTSVRRLHEVVERQTGLPPERQHLYIVEQRPYTRLQQAFWSAMRVVYAYWCTVFGAAATALRLLVHGEDTALRLLVKSEDGREVSLRLPGDVSLHQLQDLMEQQHGESFRVASVAVLPPSRGGGGSGGGCGGSVGKSVGAVGGGQGGGEAKPG